MNTEQLPNLPLTSTFTESLVLHTVLSEACRVLDDPSSDELSRIIAENEINLILNSIELPEE